MNWDEALEILSQAFHDFAEKMREFTEALAELRGKSAEADSQRRESIRAEWARGKELTHLIADAGETPTLRRVCIACAMRRYTAVTGE